MRSVVKHSYVKGLKAKARLVAHVKYIGNRPGPDREEGRSRVFFDNRRDDIGGKEFRDSLEEIKPSRAVVAHKLILSPGLQGVNIKDYTRELLQEVGRRKGLDLNWAAVVHKNTDHDHAHVIVFADDKSGRLVTFDRNDHKYMREVGDRYLEREHYYERFLQRDSDRVLKGYEYERGGDLEFKRLVGDVFRKDPARDNLRMLKEWDKEKAQENLPDSQKINFEGVVYSKYSTKEELMKLEERLSAPDAPRIPLDQFHLLGAWINVKERLGDAYYEPLDKGDKEISLVREFQKFDKDLRRSLAGEGEVGRRMSRDARVREIGGRFSDYHELYTSSMAKERLNQLRERHPEMAGEVEKELEFLKTIERESRFGGEGRWKDLDEILGDDDRWSLDAPKREEKSPDREGEARNEQQNFVDQHVQFETKKQEQERDRDDEEREQERSDL